MEKVEMDQALENGFVATFIRELIPGILHNFANPLNGIMGRSKLVQRRIDDHVRKLEELYPEASLNLKNELLKIQSDIRSVANESESFFEMFRDVSGKFYALAAKGEDNINLSQLLNAEMRFANFYLDFKHEVRKEVDLDQDIPEFRGKTADLSMAFWRLIRFAMNQALASDNRQFSLTTSHDADCVNVTIRYSGVAMPEEAISDTLEFLDGGINGMRTFSVDHGVVLALVVLNRYSARVMIDAEAQENLLSISLPYQGRGKRTELKFKYF